MLFRSQFALEIEIIASKRCLSSLVVHEFTLETEPRTTGAVQNNKGIMTVQTGPRRPSAAQSRRRTNGANRSTPNSANGAQRHYERYIALARAEDQNGNTVAAENYYQYAEHYFRSLSSGTEGT